MSTVYVGVVNDEIVAFHNNRTVMNTYLYYYKETNPSDTVSLCKMRKKDAKENPHYYPYWLVSCNETYVQSKYEYILSMNTSEYSEKVELLKRLKQLLFKTKRKKDRAVLIDTISIIEKNKKRWGTYTPSLTMLNEEYWRYESYRANVDAYL